VHKGFLRGNIRKKSNLEELGVDVRIMLSLSRSGVEKHRLSGEEYITRSFTIGTSRRILLG
jgi:hypothetical protein